MGISKEKDIQNKMITTEQIKELRDKTGLSVMQCKKALESAAGDMQKALEFLKAAGAEIAAKKGERALGAGVVATYIHGGGTIGSMIELNSETDFVAKNPEFGALAQEIAMQVAAMNPETVVSLLEQPYIKNPGDTIGGLIQGAIQKFGENIAIRRFTRFALSD